MWSGVGDQDTAFLEILALEVQGHIAEIELMNLPTPARPEVEAALLHRRVQLKDTCAWDFT